MFRIRPSKVDCASCTGNPVLATRWGALWLVSKNDLHPISIKLHGKVQTSNGTGQVPLPPEQSHRPASQVLWHTQLWAIHGQPEQWCNLYGTVYRCTVQAYHGRQSLQSTVYGNNVAYDIHGCTWLQKLWKVKKTSYKPYPKTITPLLLLLLLLRWQRPLHPTVVF